MSIGLASFLAMVGPVGAGSITDLQLYDGTNHAPIVTITYSTADGASTLSASVYADPMVSGGTVVPAYDCVDLWHDNYLGSSYTITPVAGIAYSTSTFKDVDNRIAWLMNQAQDTPDERAAVQLAIWYVTDNAKTAGYNGFSFTGGDHALRKDYHRLIKFHGYDPSKIYDAQFYAATHDWSGHNNQDLVSVNSVPRPGGVVLSLLGLAGAVVLCRRRAGLGRRGDSRVVGVS